MVATVQVGEKNSVGGTFTDKTSGTIRFKSVDEAVVDTTNPITIPSSGTAHSFEKWTRLKITAGPDNVITNLKFYTDGANGFGADVRMYARNRTAFAEPGNPDSAGGFVDAFNYTANGALSISDGTDEFSAAAEIGEHAVLLLEVSSGASQGTLTAETVTYSYDET